MDEYRFDQWTQLVASQANPRDIVKGLTGTAAAFLTMARVERVIAQNPHRGLPRQRRALSP